MPMTNSRFSSTTSLMFPCDSTVSAFSCLHVDIYKLTGTAAMLGPPRSSDTGAGVVPGHGILINLAQPLIAAPSADEAARRRLRVRLRRAAPNMSGGSAAALARFDVDELLMGGAHEKPVASLAAVPVPLPGAASPSASAPFGGIHIRHLDSLRPRNISLSGNSS